ncbi:hypothetical protein KGY79_08865 [Candidatus Bipolaricaulota bacterium]|nr:hypothetical protein [Candidatus Bipolaricaulota bacterium]
MNSRNQARVFQAEESYFEPPKNLNSKNQNSDKNLTLGQAIEDFKLRGKVEGRAEKTLEQYSYVFNRFLER